MSLFAAALLLVLFASVCAAAPPAIQCTLGIRYALAPEGPLRFRPPVLVANLTQSLANSTLSCDPYAIARTPACPQATAAGSFWLNNTQEDCLFLNVFAPSGGAGGLPVAVFFYGGSFTSGSISVPLYNGAAIAASQNVVVVTVNYRLGALGFLSLPALFKESNTTGNWGVLDQISALMWVQANIASFGGDETKVTIFGESAGGASVCALMTAPAAEGLFRGAIMESGLCQDAFPLNVTTLLSTAVGGALLCAPSDVACFRAAKWQTIVGAQYAGGAAQAALDTPWAPTIDNAVLFEKPVNMIAAGHVIKSLKTVLIGTNLNETNVFSLTSAAGRNMSLADLYHQLTASFHIAPAQAQKLIALYMPSAGQTSGAFHATKSSLAYAAMLSDFVFTCVSQSVASLLSQRGVDTYAYVFGRTPSCGFDTIPAALRPLLGAAHAFELPFVFDVDPSIAKKCQPDQGDHDLSARIIDYWGGVFTAGAPATSRAGGLPSWPKFDNVTRQSVFLDVPSDGIVGAYRAKFCVALGLFA
jgi:para-nitrobenzyl esterase